MPAGKQRLTFISYSRVDAEFALELARELRSSGFMIWLDQLDIPPGARWDDEIERALEQCEIFMVILTPNSITSDNVKDEIGYAIDSGKRILPVLLQDAKVPFRLRRFQYVNFTDKSHAEGIQAAEQLLEKLIRDPTGPNQVSPSGTPSQLDRPAELKADANRLARLRAAAVQRAREQEQLERSLQPGSRNPTYEKKVPPPPPKTGSFPRLLSLAIGIPLLLLLCFGGGWIARPFLFPTATATELPPSTEIQPSISVPSDTPPPTTTPTTEPTIPSTFTATVPPTPVPASVERIFFDSSRTHIGDEDLDQSLWTPLLDECYDQPFDVSLPIDSMLLTMRFYDTDADNSIRINDIFLAYIPNQNIPHNGFWDSFSVTIPQDYVQAGANRLKICTGLIPPSLADHENDKDDIQLQAVEITVQR